MKKTFIATLTMVLAVGIGSAFANGVTDFTGAVHDTFAIAPVDSKVHESSAAGSERGTGDMGYNGVTDFKGDVYDRFEMKKAGNDRILESSAAGSLRGADGTDYNGVTDFKGDVYDQF